MAAGFKTSRFFILIYKQKNIASMRIKRYEDFDTTNEGIRSSISLIGLLISLGIGTPETLWANKEKIDQSIDAKDHQVLSIVESLEKSYPGDTIFEKAIPIERLAKEIEKHNAELKSDLKIEDVIKTMQRQSFPVKIDLVFSNRGKQIPIATLNYKHSSKIMFVLSKNWDRYMYGVKFSF